MEARAVRENEEMPADLSTITCGENKQARKRNPTLKVGDR